jgi:hypothetical protein
MLAGLFALVMVVFGIEPFFYANYTRHSVVQLCFVLDSWAVVLGLHFRDSAPGWRNDDVDKEKTAFNCSSTRRHDYGGRSAQVRVQNRIPPRKLRRAYKYD